MGSYPAAKAINLTTLSFQREGAMKIESSAAPHLREGHLLVNITLDQSPAGTQFIQAETEWETAILEVKRLGFVHQSATHSSFERYDSVQGSDCIVEHVASQTVVQRVLISGQWSENGQTQRLCGWIISATGTGRLAHQSIMTQLVNS